MSDDLVDELGRSQNAYVFRAADGHNSIAIRTSDEELNECYRLMAEARDRIVAQVAQIAQLREGVESIIGSLDYGSEKSNTSDVGRDQLESLLAEVDEAARHTT